MWALAECVLHLSSSRPIVLAVTGVGPLSDGGYSIFHETMVDLTWQEVEQAARRGAIVLWPMGVVEEHGPHLPLGVDIYNACLVMKQVRRMLADLGKEAIIAPPLYWGINDATAAFPGSFIVRPSTLKALIADTFSSLRKDGFGAVYMLTGHGDKRHNAVILQGVDEARATTGLRGFVILGRRLVERVGLKGNEPYLLVVDGHMEGSNSPHTHVDVHAGFGETSMFWHHFPGLVRADIIPGLHDTSYGPADLIEWRKGWDDARVKTPLGYFGDPASADPVKGGEFFQAEVQRVAEAIMKHSATLPPRHGR